MKSGYNILWTDYALAELKTTIEYLETHWTEKEIKNLVSKIENILEFISKNPALFPQTQSRKNVRRAVVTKQNTIYYRTKGQNIEILSFFSNKQNPKKKKFL